MSSNQHQMKKEYMVGANESRIIRSFERKAKAKALKERDNKQNYPVWAVRRQAHYEERMALRVWLRHLHLARAMVNNRDYKSVENTCRDGNKPSVTYLTEVLKDFGFNPPKQFVEEWLA